MKRTHLNALIDALAFVAFLLLLTTGLLLEYRLPPGSGRLLGQGSGREAANREVELVLSWTRHEWGRLHYWIALALMTVLALHVLLHWKWIICTVRGKPSSASGYRLTLGVVGLIFAGLLAAVPLLGDASTATRGQLSGSSSAQDAAAAAAEGGANGQGEAAEHSPSIRGSMTLRQISQASDISVADLLKQLGLPANVDADTNAGRLMRQHHRTMDDLRQAIDMHQVEVHDR